MDLDILAAALRASWSRETSDDPDEWTPDRASRGQCGVTAHVIQTYFGGDILIAPVVGSHLENEHHAWNRLPSGEEIDLTRDQFRAGETLGEPWVGKVQIGDRGDKLSETVSRFLAR